MPMANGPGSTPRRSQLALRRSTAHSRCRDVGSAGPRPDALAVDLEARRGGIWSGPLIQANESGCCGGVAKNFVARTVEAASMQAANSQDYPILGANV